MTIVKIIITVLIYLQNIFKSFEKDANYFLEELGDIPFFRIPMDRLDNTNLPVITANLEMLTIETNPPPTETKRTLRKRITRPVSTEILNRR